MKLHLLQPRVLQNNEALVDQFITSRVAANDGYTINSLIESIKRNEDFLNGRLGEIKKPTLIIWGKQDGLIRSRTANISTRASPVPSWSCSTSAATSRNSKRRPNSTKRCSRFSQNNNMDLKIGDTFSTSATVTDELIRKFAEVSGDHNPIHLDEEFAKTTRSADASHTEC